MKVLKRHILFLGEGNGQLRNRDTSPIPLLEHWEVTTSTPNQEGLQFFQVKGSFSLDKSAIDKRPSLVNSDVTFFNSVTTVIAVRLTFLPGPVAQRITRLTTNQEICRFKSCQARLKVCFWKNVYEIILLQAANEHLVWKERSSFRNFEQILPAT